MGQRRILVVEDHDESRLALDRLLRMSGYLPGIASSAAAARRLAARESFDVLLVDLGLPDGTGLDLLEALRNLTAAPALAMTGFGEETLALACFEAGFRGHIVKPVEFDDLLAKIDALLSFRDGAFPAGPDTQRGNVP